MARTRTHIAFRGRKVVLVKSDQMTFWVIYRTPTTTEEETMTEICTERAAEIYLAGSLKYKELGYYAKLRPPFSSTSDEIY
jgi:hypothetical protein